MSEEARVDFRATPLQSKHNWKAFGVVEDDSGNDMFKMPEAAARLRRQSTASISKA